tara:strand:+ start:2351 stop:3400 length:1050 start_codon:yes stop_codon:yes gene_type:complete
MRQITIDKEDRVLTPARPHRQKSKGGFFKGASQGGKKKKATGRKAEPRFSTEGAFSRLGGLTVQITDRITTPFRSTKPKKSGRRKPAPAWRKPALICAAVLVVALVIGGITNFMVKSELITRSAAWMDEQQQSLAEFFGLTVQEISVVGRERTEAGDILRVLDVRRGDSILGVDPEAARERLETLGWVEAASVMRRYPDEIFIEITERRPFARWQLEGRTGVIDRTGTVVSKNDEAAFRYLPKVVGPGANAHAAELFDMLVQTPELFARLESAVRIRDRRWNLEFDKNITVQLPEKGALEAWQALGRLQNEQRILDKDVVAIDLRARDRLYVRLGEGAANIRRVAAQGS